MMNIVPYILFALLLLSTFAIRSFAGPVIVPGNESTPTATSAGAPSSGTTTIPPQQTVQPEVPAPTAVTPPTTVVPGSSTQPHQRLRIIGGDGEDD